MPKVPDGLRFADAALRQSAATTPDFIYVFDLDFRFTYANPSLLKVWNCSFEDALGKSLPELGYPPWHVEMHHRELRQVLDTGKPVSGEVPFTGGSGIYGVYEYIFTPVFDASGASKPSPAPRETSPNAAAPNNSSLPRIPPSNSSSAARP